jgi:tetratricopeptide (TPR) repeat protein/DNA-binding MarR family transcriptional regulator
VSRQRALIGPEKILLHLDDFAEAANETEAPYAVSQNGIADRTGLLRSHIPRDVRKLVKKGLVKERLSHVKSGGRSRHVYYPTWEGSLAAKEIRRRLESRPVKLELPDGARTVKMADVAGLLGVQCGLLDIALAADRGPVTAGSFGTGSRREGFVDDCGRAPAPRPFFGREKELQTILGWLHGETRVVSMLGVSGIGKTSTALGVLNEFKGRRHRLWVPIHEWETLPGLLRPLSSFLERTGRRRLGRHLAENHLPDLPSVHELLRTEFQELDAVIVIDDLQKGPPEVLDGVRAMADAAVSVNGPRLLVLSRERKRLCNPDAASRGLVRELSLGGLDQDSALRLMGNSVPAEERAGVMAAANGHPLYIELLARRGAAAGREAIEEHLRNEIYSRLPEVEKRILGTAAVLGREAPAQAMLDPGGDPAILDCLVEKNLLVRSASGVLSMHDTLREFFVSRLTPEERHKDHRRAATYLLSAGPGATLDALRHLLLAGDGPGAAAVLDESGQRLLDSGQGRPLSSEVIDKLSPADCDPGRWGRLLLLSAEARAAAGERDRALQLYKTAAEHGGETAARAWYGTGEILRERSDWEGAREAYAKASALSPSTKAAALRGLACIDWRQGDWAASSERFCEALRLARREGSGPLATSILVDMANLESDRGDAEKGLSLYSQALRILETGGSIRETARVHNNIGSVLFYEDKWDEALEHYQKCLELSERCGEVSTMAYALSNIGQILGRKGEEARALKYLDASTGIFERLGDDFMRSTNLLARGILYQTVRDWERSEKFFVEGLAVLDGLHMPREMAEARFEHGLALKGKGDGDGARKELELARGEFGRLGARRELARTERELKGLKKAKS